MKRSRYSDEPIAYALKQAEAGTAVSDVCRHLGISEATLYIWKLRRGPAGISLSSSRALGRPRRVWRVLAVMA